MIGWLKSWWSFDAQTYRAPDGIPTPDEARELVLYKSDTCGWCRLVLKTIHDTGVDVAIRNTSGSPENRQALWAATSRTRVPCMLVDGTPFFESADISDWLRAYAVRGGSAHDKQTE
jgi:glutaredoxin